MKNQAYLERLQALSTRLVALQRPIRILDAIKWPAELETTFRAKDGRVLPAIDADFYQRQKLAFDPDIVHQDLKDLKNDVRRHLGRGDALGHILKATIEQYQIVVELLRHRGQPQFGYFSRLLYGSAQDKMRAFFRTGFTGSGSSRRLGAYRHDVERAPATLGHLA